VFTISAGLGLSQIVQITGATTSTDCCRYASYAFIPSISTLVYSVAIVQEGENVGTALKIDVYMLRVHFTR